MLLPRSHEAGRLNLSTLVLRMELRLGSPSILRALQTAERLLADQRLVAVMADRLTLSAFALAGPVRPGLVGAATTEDEGLQLVLRTQPDLLIACDVLEAGYGISLLRRVKAELPTTRLLIFLERETREVVQEAMEAHADAVMFRSSMGSGESDFIQALNAVAEGKVYYPEAIRSLAAQCSPRPGLPPLVEELSARELEVAAAVARGLSNKEIGDLYGISPETVKTHVSNASDKLGASDRTQLAVLSLLYGLIDPLG
ncbi:MAG: hypothetical protein RLZZ216_183 [Cyanobacteriota bacterium]